MHSAALRTVFHPVHVPRHIIPNKRLRKALFLFYVFRRDFDLLAVDRTVFMIFLFTR